MQVTHKPSNVRKAAKLGVQLPKEVSGYAPSAKLNSGGKDVLTFGQGRITRFVSRTTEGRWTVKMGRRPMGDFANLDEAVGFAKWLGRKANRRAARGFAPKRPISDEV